MVMIDAGAEAESVSSWKKTSGATIAAMKRLRENVTPEEKNRTSRDSEAAKEKCEEEKEVAASGAAEDSPAAANSEDADPAFDFPEAKEEEKIMVRSGRSFVFFLNSKLHFSSSVRGAQTAPRGQLLGQRRQCSCGRGEESCCAFGFVARRCAVSFLSLFLAIAIIVKKSYFRD